MSVFSSFWEMLDKLLPYLTGVFSMSTSPGTLLSFLLLSFTFSCATLNILLLMKFLFFFKFSHELTFFGQFVCFLSPSLVVVYFFVSAFVATIVPLPPWPEMVICMFRSTVYILWVFWTELPFYCVSSYFNHFQRCLTNGFPTWFPFRSGVFLNILSAVPLIRMFVSGCSDGSCRLNYFFHCQTLVTHCYQ